MFRSYKVACGLAAAAVSSLLIFPCAAFGATYVSVNGEEYSSVASGEGWSWDGANTLTLENYSGGPIAAEGDLVINLVGENVVVQNADDPFEAVIKAEQDIDGDGVLAESANLSIVSESGGSLDIKAGYWGVYGEDSLTIRGADLLAYVDEVALDTNGTIEIADSTVGVMVVSDDPEAYYVDAIVGGDDASITNSRVEIVVKNTYTGEHDGDISTTGIYLVGRNTLLSIVDSSVEVFVSSSRPDDQLVGMLAAEVYVDGSEIDICVSDPEGVARGAALGSYVGSMGIYDSTVRVSSQGSDTQARGLVVELLDYYGETLDCKMIISNSNLDIETSYAALTSLYYSGASEEAAMAKRGTIVLEGSKVVHGGQVLDVDFLPDEMSDGMWISGQTVGSYGDSTGEPEEVILSGRVIIEPSENDEAGEAVRPDDGSAGDGSADDAPSGANPNAGPGAESNPVIAPTGDDAPAAGLAAAFAAIAAVVVGVVAAARRRFATN